MLSAALEALLVPAKEELVDLDLAFERISLRDDHRATELVQHRSGRLVATDPELAL